MASLILRTVFFAALAVLTFALAYTCWVKGIGTSDAAGWAQALGSVGAIFAALLIGDAQVRESRSLALKEAAERHQTAEDRAVGNLLSTIVKTWRIANAIQALKKQFGDELTRGPNGEITAEHPWLLVRGMGGLSEREEAYEPREIASAIAIKAGSAVNKMIVLDQLLASNVGIIRTYTLKRDQLAELLPPPSEVQGIKGTVEIPPELAARLARPSAELNELVYSIISSLEEDAKDAGEVLEALIRAARARHPDRDWPSLDLKKGANPSPNSPPN